MKNLATLIFTIFTSLATIGQDYYQQYIQAIIIGDTILAAQIEKDNGYKIEPIEEMKFPVRNISEHVFAMEIKELKDSIVAIFNHKNQYHNIYLNPIFYDYMSENDKSEKNKMPIVFKAETADNAIFSEAYFSNQNNSKDIYLHDFGFTWLSQLYFSKGIPLKYRTAFIIKLSKKSIDSTNVVIIAESPKVINGINGFGVHAPIARETTVQPSSIEEYSLLLFIADKLNDHTLPPLKLPKGN